MTLAVYNGVAFTVSGTTPSVAANATVEVRREDTGALASIYSDEAGTTGITNPSAFADSNGRFTFYALGLDRGYKITVTKDAFSYSLRNQAVGKLAQRDTAPEQKSIFEFCTPSQKSAILARDLSVDVTSAALAAINSFKTSDRLQNITDPEFGAIACYVGGTIIFPSGLYKLSFDQLEIDDVFGLTLEGDGSRGAADYQRGSTEFVFTGTSSGYGIRQKTNGARNLTLRKLSVTYQGGDFTGVLIDSWSSPNFHHEDCYFGTDGLTAGTRYTTASAIVQLTADHFYQPGKTVMSGAAYGVYFNTSRSTTSAGSLLSDLSLLTFYDFTEAHVATDGTYACEGMKLDGTSFDPITVQPKRALRLRKVLALSIKGAAFAGTAAAFHPSREWMSITASAGVIEACTFGTAAPPGTLDGNLKVCGNFIYNTGVTSPVTSGDGFRLWSGVISASANRFEDADKGYSIFPSLSVSGAASNGVGSPSGLIRITSTQHRLVTGMQVTISGVGGTTEANGTWTITEVDANAFDLQGSGFINTYTSGGTIVAAEALAIDLGPDTFISSCTNSYVLEQNSANLKGRINYASDRDGSSSKWSISTVDNCRVIIKNIDGTAVTNSSATYTFSQYDSGRTLFTTNASPNAQTVTSPPALSGLAFSVVKIGTGSVTVERAGSDAFATGLQTAPTSMTNGSADYGAALHFKCNLAGQWDLVSYLGNWSNIPIGLQGSATFNPAELLDAAGETTTVTVTGAALGDFAEASFSLDLQGITLTAWVSATDTVSVRFQNETGGTVNLAEGTLRARVRKA